MDIIDICEVLKFIDPENFRFGSITLSLKIEDVIGCSPHFSDIYPKFTLNVLVLLAILFLVRNSSGFSKQHNNKQDLKRKHENI